MQLLNGYFISKLLLERRDLELNDLEQQVHARTAVLLPVSCCSA